MSLPAKRPLKTSRALQLATFVVLGLICASWIQWLGQREIDSFDTGWHLATGRWIVEHGEVPTADPFNFTSDGLVWTNLNWVAQISFYKVYQWFGFMGLVCVGVLLPSAAMLCAWLDLRARKVPPLLGCVALALLAWGFMWSLHLRPRLFTYALVSYFAWILARPDPEDRLGARPAGALAVGLLLWNHLHGGFAYGYCMLAADAIGTAIASWRRGGPWIPQRSLWLSGIGLLGLASFGLHPHGYEAVIHAVEYVKRLGPVAMAVVIELLPLDFTQPLGRYAELCLGLAVLGVVFGRRPRMREALVALPFLHLALQMRRGVTPLALMALPWVALSWAPLWARVPGSARLDRCLRPGWRLLGPAFAATILVWSVAFLGTHGGPGRPNDVVNAVWNEHVLPVGAAAELQRRGGEGRIFSPFWAGGTLEWALYPQRRVHVDGRGSLHGRGTAFAESVAIRMRREGWHDLLVAHEIEYAVLRVKTELALELSKRPEWTVIYVDPVWIMLQRDHSKR